HHCRVCGFVVCAACSTSRRHLPSLQQHTSDRRYPSSGAVRVCDDCCSIVAGVAESSACSAFLNAPAFPITEVVDDVITRHDTTALDPLYG
ncbi:FYVE zinc finger domain-containing protein, partial [Lactococcus petauri]|uniref:FYVE zinc finger domain-containing protein n=1 Tax=Lactococcus petauri TaxID=1940789 RepID=UPI0034DB3826